MARKNLGLNLEPLKFSVDDPGVSYRNEYREELLTREAIAECIVRFANAGGGTLYMGVQEDGTVRGLSVGGNTRDWEASVRTLVDEACKLIQPVFVELVGVYFDHCSGTPLVEERISPKTRTRSHSSPRSTKPWKIIVRVCVDRSKNRYTFASGTPRTPTTPKTPRTLKTYEDLRRENTDLKIRLHALEDKFKAFEDKLRQDVPEKSQEKRNWLSWLW